MQPDKFTRLCSNISKVTTNESVLPHAQEVSSKFITAFDLFSKCHRGYNSNVVDDKAIEDLGTYIKYTGVLFYPKLWCCFHRKGHCQVPAVLQGHLSQGNYFAKNAHSWRPRHSVAVKMENRCWYNGRTGSWVHSCPYNETWEATPRNRKWSGSLEVHLWAVSTGNYPFSCGSETPSHKENQAAHTYSITST